MKNIVITNKYRISLSMIALFLILTESTLVSFQWKYSIVLIMLFLLGISYFLIQGIKYIPRINKFELIWIICMLVVAFNNIFLQYGEKSYPICFFGMGIFIFYSKYSEKWDTEIVKLLPRIMLVYALTTLIFFILPDNVYNVISNVLFGGHSFGGVAAGLTIHYSTNGMYLAVGVCLYFSLYSNENYNKLKKNYLYAMFICIAALLMTGKRGPLIATILSCLLILFITNRGKVKGRSFKIISIIGIGAIILIILSFLIPELANTFIRFTESSDNLSNGRDLLYKNALELFKEHPIYGIGWNKFKYIQSAMIFSDSTNIHDVHNIYLQLLCESGIIGFISYSFAFIYSLRISLKYLEEYRKSKDENNYKVFSIVIVFQCFFLLYGITGNPLYDETMMIPYFIIISIINKHYYTKYKMRRNSEKERSL